MVVQLKIDYDQLVELVEQLPEDQQKALITRVLTDRSHQRPLTAEEKMQLLEAAVLNNPVKAAPSVRREDWYGDDGR